MKPKTSLRLGTGLCLISATLSTIDVYRTDGPYGAALFAAIMTCAYTLVWRLGNDIMSGRPWRWARIRAYLLMVRREVLLRRTIDRQHLRYAQRWLDTLSIIERHEVQYSIDHMWTHGAEPCDIARAVDHWKRGVLFIPTTLTKRRPYL